ncbi:MAG: HEAT repeat domain-containing protein [Gemmatimonadales bacterium]
MRASIALSVALILTAGQSARAQSLASRVGQMRDGTVSFSYATLPDVCGDGENNIQVGEHTHIRYNSRDRYRPCEYGPARITLELSGGEVTRVRTAVGGTPRQVDRDLGRVRPAEAVSYLFGLARTSRGRAGEQAVFPITLADSVDPWPEMLSLARSRDVAGKTRKSAIFWLGQEAGEVATRGLSEIVDQDDEDREVKESAVFSLSQLPGDQGVPILIRVAKTNSDPRIRRSALFWLGQSDDPRALALFEEILAGR